MSASTGRGTAESASCPLLGLPDDRVTRFSFPSVAHRCYAANRPRPIDLGHQAAFCLAATFPDCDRYRPAVAPGRQAAAAPVTSAVVPGRTRAAGAGPGTSGSPAGPGTFGEPGNPGAPWPRPPRRSRLPVRAVAILIAFAGLAAVSYLATTSITDWVRHPGSDAAASRPSPSAAPSATSTPTAAASTRGSNAPGSPTAPTTATPAPSAPVSPARIHVVVKGETLSGIAAEYGVTVTAIRDANHISDTSLIFVGEHLVIPAP